MVAVLEKSPAARVIELCGGIGPTSGLVERDRSVVNRWLLSKEKGGTGGIIPAHHQVKLLIEAPKHGIKLTSSDFFDDENDPARANAQDEAALSEDVEAA